MSSVSNNLRIVIDTNVFISAIVFGGKPRQIIDLIAEDAVIIVIAEEIATEIRRIIVEKFPDFLEDLAKIERLLEEDAEWVKLGFHTIGISRDPDDDKFIETAVTGQAEYIISGDEDLLNLELYRNIRIMQPADFLKLFDQ